MNIEKGVDGICVKCGQLTKNIKKINGKKHYVCPKHYDKVKEGKWLE